MAADGPEPDPAPDDSLDELPRPALPPTWGEILRRVPTLDRRRLAVIGAVALLLAGAAVAGYALLRPPPVPPTEDLLPMAGAAPAGSSSLPSSTTITATTAAAEIVVHAAGAVGVPGVHRLPGGSRVADLLAAAGGPIAGADIDRVNLAAPLTDGERIWFPRVGEEAPPVVAGTPPAPPPSASGTTAAPGGPVDLNTASAEQLDTLPGVGPATATAIIEHRERQGPFRSVDDLLDVPGIGDAKLAQLRDLVTV